MTKNLQRFAVFTFIAVAALLAFWSARKPKDPSGRAQQAQAQVAPTAQPMDSSPLAAASPQVANARSSPTIPLPSQLPQVQRAFSDLASLQSFLEANKAPKGVVFPEKMKQKLMKLEAALKDESLARKEMNDLAACVTNDMRDIDNQILKQVPPYARDRVRSLGTMLQAQCLTTGRKLVEKFPRLRETFQNNVLSKARPEAVQLANPARQ